MSVRARWNCPLCKDGVLAPRRPRRDDVRRYCLPCSARKGRLVERVCAALENKRAAKRAKAKEKQRKAYSFKAPKNYYITSGIDLADLFLRCDKYTWREAAARLQLAKLRARDTYRVGPATIKRDAAGVATVTFHRPKLGDAYDAKAQAVCAAGRLLWEHLGGGEFRHRLRDLCDNMLGVRPRLTHTGTVEIEVASLIRAKVACAVVEKLSDDTAGRKSG